MLDWSGAAAVAAVAALEDEDAEELSFLGVGLSPPPPPLASPLVMAAAAAATEDLLPFGVLLLAEIFLTEDDFFLGVTSESFLPRGVLGAAAAALSRGVEGALPVWPGALWLEEEEEEEEASLMLLPTPLVAANGGGGGAAAAAAEEAGAGGATSAIVVPRTQDYA